MRNGKFIRWNNDGYCYIGDSNNNLAKFANYTDITNLQNQIAGLSFDAGGEFKLWSVTSYRDTMVNLISYEPSGVLFFPAFSNFGGTIGIFMNYVSHQNQWWISVNSTSGGYRASGVSNIRTTRFDDIVHSTGSITYPITMHCLVWK